MPRAAAAAGLLGSGPLARATTAVPGAFSVEYERFTRYQAPQTLQIHLAPAVTSRREARLWISRAFLDSSKIESVIPTPLRVEGGADRLYYVFQMAKPADPLSVALNLQAEHIGFVDGRIGVDDGREVAFRQLVYPCRGGAYGIRRPRRLHLRNPPRALPPHTAWWGTTTRSPTPSSS